MSYFNEVNQAREIIGRIKKKNFSGNEGRAIKNSSWQIATTMVAKIGSFLFTIIIARLMLPEIYGLYGLALSTILFMGIFSDMGIGATLTTFMSKRIDKNPGKAKGQLFFLTKYKIILTAFSSMLLLLLAGWLANSFYSKPIYYALIAGAIYLPTTILSGYLGPVFVSKNNFRPQFIRELIIQLSRITIIPISIIYFLKKVGVEEYLFSIFILLSICYFLGGIYFFISLKMKNPFNKRKAANLTKKEKKEIVFFSIPLAATSLSGVFFGYIDQIMLGHYVQGQFLAFYQVSFYLAISASSIIAFSGLALFPIFARLKGRRLERGFEKSKKITFLISILSAIFTFIAAPYIINIAYGPEYSTAITYLRMLVLVMISFPMISLYSTYYTTQGKIKSLSLLLIISTIINIVLNYIFINIGLSYSMFHAVSGACIATIISRYMYLIMLIVWRKK